MSEHRWKLREPHDDADLALVYDHQYDHTRWEDHKRRITYTRDFVDNAIWMWGGIHTVADLSCGDGAITKKLVEAGFDVTLGDFHPGWPIQGKIEDTIETIPNVDLFICSETLEHVKDPDGLMHAIRAKAKYAIFSTPANERVQDNPEHYWGWTVSGINTMLSSAGWHPVLHYVANFGYYDHQFWACQ